MSRGLLTLVERKTQLAKITTLQASVRRATQKAAVRRLKPIGDFVHTITFDNGKEFAAHQDIAHALKTKMIAPLKNVNSITQFLFSHFMIVLFVMDRVPTDML